MTTNQQDPYPGLSHQEFIKLTAAQRDKVSTDVQDWYRRNPGSKSPARSSREPDKPTKEKSVSFHQPPSSVRSSDLSRPRSESPRTKSVNAALPPGSADHMAAIDQLTRHFESINPDFARYANVARSFSHDSSAYFPSERPDDESPLDALNDLHIDDQSDYDDHQPSYDEADMHPIRNVYDPTFYDSTDESEFFDSFDPSVDAHPSNPLFEHPAPYSA